MQVENGSAYTSSLYTRAAHGAENKDGKQASTPAPSQSGETNTANTAKTGPVTGTTGSNLSKEVIDQLMAEAQETSVSNDGTKEYDGPLSIGERHHLEDIVNNPEYAASEAKMFGTGMELIRGFSSMAEAQAYFSKGGDNRFHAKLADMQQVVGERAAYYENLKGQGLTPAETYAKLLEFNVNLPPSHDTTLGWTEFGRPMSYSDYNQTRLDYLQNLIAKTNSSEVQG